MVSDDHNSFSVCFNQISHSDNLTCNYLLLWLSTGFSAAYASYAGRGGYAGYPSFGYPFAGLSLNQLQGICIPLDHINNVHVAAAALQQL